MNYSENTVTGGAAVVECLKQADVDCVFGVLGGSMLELYDAIHQSNDLRYIGARDEDRLHSWPTPTPASP